MEVQDGLKRLLQVWVSFRSRQEILVATEFLVLCRDRGSLCRNMVLRLQTVARSRHSLSMSHSVLLLCFDNVVTEVSLSQRDGHDKRFGVIPFMLQQSLVRAKGFYVATGFSLYMGFLVATDNSLSRHGLA